MNRKRAVQAIMGIDVEELVVIIRALLPGVVSRRLTREMAEKIFDAIEAEEWRPIKELPKAVYPKSEGPFLVETELGMRIGFVDPVYGLGYDQGAPATAIRFRRIKEEKT